MKFSSVLLLIAFIAYTQAAGLSDEEKAEYKEFKKACGEENHLDEDTLKKVMHDGEVGDDDKLKQFFVCFFKKLEIMTADGKLDEEHFKERLVKKFGDDVAAKIHEACFKDLDDEVKTATALTKCYHKHAPKSH